MVSKSNDGLTQHSDGIYLREEFEQFKRESQMEIQRLREQIEQTQRKTKRNRDTSEKFIDVFR